MATLRWIGVELSARTSLASQDGCNGRDVPTCSSGGVRHTSSSSDHSTCAMGGGHRISSCTNHSMCAGVEYFAPVIVESVVPALAMSQHQRLVAECAMSAVLVAPAPAVCAQRQRQWRSSAESQRRCEQRRRCGVTSSTAVASSSDLQNKWQGTSRAACRISRKNGRPGWWQ